MLRRFLNMPLHTGIIGRVFSHTDVVVLLEKSSDYYLASSSFKVAFFTSIL